MPEITRHTEIFNDLLRLAVESGASAIVIKSNKPGSVRLSGRLKSVDRDPISCPEAQAFVDERVLKVFRKKSAESGLGVSSALRPEVRELIPRVVELVRRFGQEARDSMPAGKSSIHEF